ncbi:MAG: hypothetical protein GEU87_15400 [Alphaproteobacteria bacterium]|nr:hypothetical protein [Alphaproteobacteria bacterium]
MLKKFLHGIAFGAGFGIALVAVWVGATFFLLPRLVESEFASSGEPELSDRKTAELLHPQRGPARTVPEFRIFKDSERYEMTIPEGGGILTMTVLPTESEAQRPRTFQLWLTGTELWKIRTEETKVLIERMTYPSSDPVKSLDRVMRDNMGRGLGKSTMTVSQATIEGVRRGEECAEDDHLNGEFRMTTEGVLFLMPNEIKR